jgi:hypothetical protein
MQGKPMSNEFQNRKTLTFLEILARHNPQIWDALRDRVPQSQEFHLPPKRWNVLSAAVGSLNPQPIPPLAETIAESARNIVQAALTLQAAGLGGEKLLMAEIDGLCGNGQFSKIWHLRPHPWTGGGEPPPRPEELQAIAALTFAGIALRMDAHPLRDVLETGVDTLLDASARAQEMQQKARF